MLFAFPQIYKGSGSTDKAKEGDIVSEHLCSAHPEITYFFPSFFPSFLSSSLLSLLPRPIEIITCLMSQASLPRPSLQTQLECQTIAPVQVFHPHSFSILDHLKENGRGVPCTYTFPFVLRASTAWPPCGS